MTINIKKDRIEFVSNEGTTFTLKETGDGFSFDGVIEGTNIFQDGFQGSISGYSAGGLTISPPARVNIIDKFPFATDSNATDVGDIGATRNNLVNPGHSSDSSGYVSGGLQPSPGVEMNTIEKWPFATDTNATDVGDLTQARRVISGQSSRTHGYSSGGLVNPPFATFNTIDKFPFTVDTNATDVGDLTATKQGASGHTSSSFGYSSGGVTSPPARLNSIDKFPFSADSNATDVGDLVNQKTSGASQSSFTDGYNSGGDNGPAYVNTIERFPFASDANATDVGDLSQTRGDTPAGQSSSASGYSSGGTFTPTPPTAASTNVIDKFPFATISNATDVGDLTLARGEGLSGAQS